MIHRERLVTCTHTNSEERTDYCRTGQMTKSSKVIPPTVITNEVTEHL